MMIDIRVTEIVTSSLQASGTLKLVLCVQKKERRKRKDTEEESKNKTPIIQDPNNDFTVLLPTFFMSKSSACILNRTTLVIFSYKVQIRRDIKLL